MKVWHARLVGLAIGTVAVFSCWVYIGRPGWPQRPDEGPAFVKAGNTLTVVDKTAPNHGAVFSVANATDVPEVKFKYTAQVGRGVTMTVTSRYSAILDHVGWSGELDQPDGGWVLFDPEKPADKILDRELLPAVTKLCAAIMETDKWLRDQNKNSFTDEKGTTWQKDDGR